MSGARERGVELELPAVHGTGFN